MYAMYYVSMLRCWQLVRILVRTNHPWLRVGRHSVLNSTEVTSICKALMGLTLCLYQRLITLRRWGIIDLYLCLILQSS
jgi:hypothetical protein